MELHMTELTISCPRGHGTLAAMVPETLDGSSREVGFCSVCAGMWIPPDLVASMVPEEVRAEMVWAKLDEPGAECSCGRFPGQLTFRSQQIGGVVIDRCDQCVCLWLDGGELDGLGGPGIGDCVAETFVTGAAIVTTWGMGGDSEDRIEHRVIDGADVTIWYDDEPAPGEPTRFSWRGQLAKNDIRGTVGKETAGTRLLRKLGIKDIEVGEPEFDAKFRIVSSDEASMRRWLQRPEVPAALWAVRQRAAGVLNIWRDGFEVTGWLPDGSPTPDTELDHACETLYRSLRSTTTAT